MAGYWFVFFLSYTLSPNSDHTFYIQYCIYRVLLKLTWCWDCLLIAEREVYMWLQAVLAPFGGGGRYDNATARRSGKKQWGGSQSKLWLSRMDIIFVLLGWCRYHNGSSVPLKCCSDNGLASHAFREGASSFTETLSWPQTLFPLAALIPCPAKLSSRDAVAVSFDALPSGFRNCFESTWGHKPPCLPSPFPRSSHASIKSSISEVL